MSIRGHYDGKVIVLDEPGDLRPNQRVTVFPEPAGIAAPAGDAGLGTLRYVVARIGAPISSHDAAEMIDAIEEAFEQVDPDSKLPRSNTG